MCGFLMVFHILVYPLAGGKPMRRTFWLRETRLMRFGEAYDGWTQSRLIQEQAAQLLGQLMGPVRALSAATAVNAVTPRVKNTLRRLAQ